MTQFSREIKNFYRPDIDGLRAIAVLAVVLHHLNPIILPGGFVGVDVFFVISGFLVTGNIIKYTNSSRGFVWKEFCRRRILRLLPVLFVVLLVTLLAGQLIMLPEDVLELSYSALAAIIFVANIYFTFFLDTSYFSADSSVQPLLHLWSLGVEEQFYLSWPFLLIILLNRFSRKTVLWVTLLISCASFLLAKGLLSNWAMFAYYMLPSRAGELLIGAVLAIWLSGGSELPKPLRVPLGVMGLAFIADSFIFVADDIALQGVNYLLASLGAALLICAGSGQPNSVSKFLALRPLVLIGLASYSLYLWHWPIIALYRYIYVSVDLFAGILLLVLALMLSFMSYRWVETPCRYMSWDLPRTLSKVFVMGVVPVFALCIGLLLSRGYGVYVLNSQYRDAIMALKPSSGTNSYSYVCQSDLLTEGQLLSKKCIINSEEEPDVLLWGDSNAAHYVGVLGAFAEEAGFSFRNAAHNNCAPLISGTDFALKSDGLSSCLASVKTVKKYLHRYSTVILAAAWDGYFMKSDEFRVHLEETVDSLVSDGKRVIILGQIPLFKGFNHKCELKALKLSMISCKEHESEPDQGEGEFNNYLANVAASRQGVYYFNIRELMCHAGRCTKYINGDSLYFDMAHLSMNGSWALGRSFIEQRGVPEIFARLAPISMAISPRAVPLRSRNSFLGEP